MKQDPFDNNRPDFNQAILFVDTLNKEQQMACDLLRDGELLGTFRTLKNVFLMIKYKIRKSEDKSLFGSTYHNILLQLDRQFKRASNLLKADTKLMKMNLTVSDGVLEEIREWLYYLQWDLDLIFPAKNHTSWQDKVKANFE